MMRNRLLLVFLVAGLLVEQAYGQKKLQISFPDVDWKTGWSAGAKVGTLGLGIEGIKSVNKNWNARLGVSYLPFQVSRDIMTGNMSLTVNADTRLGGVNLQGDFFFVRWFYFTGGLLANFSGSSIYVNLKEEIQFGDITINPADIGNFTTILRPGWPVSPFLGIGFGSNMPVNRPLWFNIEIGAAYCGKPRFNLKGTGMITPTANEANEKALELAFKGYQFYPLFSTQLVYRIR